MNKQELVNAVAKRTKQTKAASAAAVDAVLKSIQDAIRKGEEVRLIGFGTFSRRNVAKRKVRNPRTGEELNVPACKKVKFAPGKEFKKAANG